MRHTCFIFLIAWISFNHQASGQQISYPVSSIDTALLRNALIVVRKNEMVININSLTSETITRHTVTTLLKSGASAKATCVAHYNEWTDIDRFEGCIYDAKGLLVKKLGKKEIVDESAIGDGSLYSDERVKIIRPVITEYPVTVEYFIKQTSSMKSFSVGSGQNTPKKQPSFTPKKSHFQAQPNLKSDKESAAIRPPNLNQQTQQ